MTSGGAESHLKAKTPYLRKVLMLGGGGEIRTPAPGLPRLTI